MKRVRSFLGEVGFYRRFIKDFSGIAYLLCNLLEKNVKFEFHKAFMKAFVCLQENLTTAHSIIAPDWSKPFELMCHANSVALRTMLGQSRDNILHPVYYSNKTLNDTLKNYTITEKELLAFVYAFEEFRAYLLGTKDVVHKNHDAICYIMNKKEAKSRLIHWCFFFKRLISR